jgi:1,4-dihydroxy-2-naphthoate octaprenyltransferase
MAETFRFNFISIKDFKDVVTNFRAWFKNSRPIALPQSLLPVISAVAIAFSFSAINNYDFNFYLAILSIVGVSFGHLGSNL